ncbi:MAG: entericidin [Chthoniobacterales bacterium]
MKSLSLVTLFVAFSLLLTGCNTVRGLGEDISGSSSYVQKKMTGEDTQPSNPPQWPK